MNNPPVRAYESPLQIHDLSSTTPTYPALTKIVSTVALLVLGYYTLTFLDAWPDTIKRTVFEIFVYLIPSPFISTMQYGMVRLGLLDLEEAKFQRKDHGDMFAKQAALNRMFGQRKLPFALGRVGVVSGVGGYLSVPRDPTPPGLGNWDNSCYQNSVLQGLASLPAFHDYVRTSLDLCNRYNVVAETHRALDMFLEQLAESSAQRTVLWTPSVLKSMDSWQQQDAQEYFSRVLEAVEKESLKYAKAVRMSSTAGLECLRPIRPQLKATTVDDEPLSSGTQSSLKILKSATGGRAQLEAPNPMDGMTAQGLICKTCGYTEGLSLTQFTCLTLNLGLRGLSSIEDLLDDYTAPEEVDGVECDRCTQLAYGKAEDKIAVEHVKSDASPATKPQQQKQQNPILRTKAKQITVGRLPKDLVFHINRSIFDDFGNQKKNSAPIRFPARLNFLSRWCAPLNVEDERIDAVYELRCVVTHYGRHDNGHYVALGKRDKNWYSFNDDIVTRVTEEDVLSRSNGFIFFYGAVTQVPDCSVDETPAGTVAELTRPSETRLSTSIEHSVTHEQATHGTQPETKSQVEGHGADAMSIPVSRGAGSSRTASTDSDSSSLSSAAGAIDSRIDKPVLVMRTAPETRLLEHGQRGQSRSVALGPAF